MSDGVKLPGLFEGLFSDDCVSLSCRTKEVCQAAMWPSMLAGVVATGAIILYNVNKWMANNREWAKDLREHRQEAASRYQRINAFLIVGGIIATALAVLKVVGSAVTAMTAGAVFGGIWIGVGAAVVLNHWVHKQSVLEDGRDLAGIRR